MTDITDLNIDEMKKVADSIYAVVGSVDTGLDLEAALQLHLDDPLMREMVGSMLGDDDKIDYMIHWAGKVHDQYYEALNSQQPKPESNVIVLSDYRREA